MAVIHFISKDLEAAFFEQQPDSYRLIDAPYLVQVKAYDILNDLDAIQEIEELQDLPSYNHDASDPDRYCAVITINGAEPLAAITFVCVLGSVLAKSDIKTDFEIEPDRLYKIEVQLHKNEP